MAQAEAEYKDFILFYPAMEEAAQAQNRVCEIHYKQMDKSDRDITETIRAEDECRQLLVQFPNSKFAPQAAQRLRNIQESLAEHEFVVGTFYWKHDMNPAAANRLDALVGQYPLYSKAGESLFEAGDAYSKMGPRFRKEAGEKFAQIIKDYPLSGRAEEAKRRLEDLEMPVPQADRAAYDREKYEVENYKKPGLMARSMGWLRSGPDMSHAAKAGNPTMTDPKRTIPASVPIPANTEVASAAGAGSGTAEVSAATVNSTDTALDKKPDARSAGATQTTAGNVQTAQPLPTNRDRELKKYRDEQAKKQAKLNKKRKKKEQNSGNQQNQTQPVQTPAGQPAASSAVPNGTASAVVAGQHPPDQQ
jgi:outer membrane protein assembly factor BamD